MRQDPDARLGPCRLRAVLILTEEPGIGWSPWRAPSQQIKTIANTKRAKVSSPPGRYLQYHFFNFVLCCLAL